ncbi:MAG: class IV adenylate cyclase, partial [archaeon]
TMIEVEVKARVKGFDEIKQALKKKEAKFLGKKRQSDRIFAIPEQLDEQNMMIKGGILGRIREEDGKKELEFKETDRKTGSAAELKFKIDDLAPVERILKKLGFVESRLGAMKTREEYSYKGFNICLDEVERLGTFVEVEKIVEKEADKEKDYQECIDFLKELTPDFEIEERKYGDMLQELVNERG